MKKGGIFMATLTINTDEKTAENFYAFCEELGLDMSTAMTLFMKTCYRIVLAAALFCLLCR